MEPSRKFVKIAPRPPPATAQPPTVIYPLSLEAQQAVIPQYLPLRPPRKDLLASQLKPFHCLMCLPTFLVYFGGLAILLLWFSQLGF